MEGNGQAKERDVYTTIVVGADESETAGVALEHAAALARQFGSHVHIVTAYKPTLVDKRGLPREIAASLTSDSKVEALLADLSSRVRTSGIAVSTHAARADPADAIINVASDVKADLIVVGNKGMQGARRVLGSVPNSVAHQAQCAVLIVNTR